LEKYLEGFAKQDKNASGTKFVVESFSDLHTYKNALMSAFFRGEAPDVFVMQSGDTSLFDDTIQVLDPNSVSPNDFRKDFYGVFGDDLIITSDNDKKTEYLKGVPV